MSKAEKSMLREMTYIRYFLLLDTWMHVRESMPWNITAGCVSVV